MCTYHTAVALYGSATSVVCLPQGGLQLLIRVEHNGDNLLDDNQLIDRVIIELFLSVDDSPLTFSGTGEQGTVSALVSQVSVACEGAFFGADCNTFCIKRDDSTGHFRCGEDGSIVCLSGYQNPETNCTECVPAPNCCMLSTEVWKVSTVDNNMLSPQLQLEGSAASLESVSVGTDSPETSAMKVRFFTIFVHLHSHVWAVFAEVVSTVLNYTCQGCTQSLHQF